MPVYEKYVLWCDAVWGTETIGECRGYFTEADWYPGGGRDKEPALFPDMSTLTEVATAAGWMVREEEYPRFLCPSCLEKVNDKETSED